ncbi:hypothetical protein B0H17DRAFT_1185326 [Mycena rosella]|uniref:Uncharacterized protein n=1 Tax=Mycena rosella TaxID=1033263 RepID=A0AAD7CS64_MYCRO|nr:hypothetical protein B0H17DRAFT_1185326 [Mycena rosella]
MGTDAELWSKGWEDAVVTMTVVRHVYGSGDINRICDLDSWVGRWSGGALGAVEPFVLDNLLIDKSDRVPNSQKGNCQILLFLSFMAPSFSHMWTPRLRPFEDDEELFTQEPFLSVFHRYHNMRENARILDKLISELQSLLRSAYWVGISMEFVSYCLGDEITAPSLNKQIQLFVMVLWLRYQHHDNSYCTQEVEKCLLDAQIKWSNSVVPQISLVQDLAQQEDVQGDPPRDDSSDSESDSEDDVYFDLFEVDSFTTNADEKPRSKTRVVTGLVEMRKLKPQVFKTSEFLIEFERSKLWETLLNICRPGNLLETSHPDVELSFRFHSWRISYGEMLCRWTPPIRLIPLEITAKQPGRQFDPAEFLVFFNSNPRMHPWRSNPMAAYMFISLSAFRVNCRIWLVPCLETLGFETAGWNLQQIYRDLMRHPVMQKPELSPPLLATLDIHLRTVITETAFHRKLIKTVNYEVFHPLNPKSSQAGSDSKMDAGNETDTRNETDEDAPTDSSPPVMQSAENSSSAVHILGKRPTTAFPKSKIQKKNLKRREKKKLKVNQGLSPAQNNLVEDLTQIPAVPGFTNDCTHCAHKAEEDRCVRIIYVKDNPKAAKYIGCAITAAPEGDRIKPKQVKNKKSRIYKRTYIHPMELGLRLVEARPPEHPVWIDCGRDIVRFIHRRKDSKEHLVAGVRFKALSPTMLKIMQENHRQVRIRTIRRRADMQAWAYGSMTATGSRMPMGGKKGDGYAPYACHSGDSVDDIKALFRHAVDTDILVTAAKSIYLGIEADLSELTEESELNRFGRFGAVGFYCTNFISPIHTDKDTVKVDRPTLHPCIQLSKENCGSDDYNFAMMWKEPRLAGTFAMAITFVGVYDFNPSPMTLSVNAFTAAFGCRLQRGSAQCFRSHVNGVSSSSSAPKNRPTTRARQHGLARRSPCTPATSVSSSPPPPKATPLCETERLKAHSSMLQTPRDPSNPVRENPKNEYATGLVDQAVKSLCEIWHPQDIPNVFLASSQANVGSCNELLPPTEFRRRCGNEVPPWGAVHRSLTLSGVVFEAVTLGSDHVYSASTFLAVPPVRFPVKFTPSSRLRRIAPTRGRGRTRRLDYAPAPVEYDLGSECAPPGFAKLAGTVRAYPIAGSEMGLGRRHSHQSPCCATPSSAPRILCNTSLPAPRHIPHIVSSKTSFVEPNSLGWPPTV